MSLEDTPRTYCAQYDVTVHGAYADSVFKRVVDAAFAEQLERELAAAITAREKAERERDALKAYMFAHLRHKDPIVKELEHIVGRWEEAEQAK